MVWCTVRSSAPGCANAARIERTALSHAAFARRDRVIADCFAPPLRDQPQLRDGNALKEAAVHVPARDQVTDQRPCIPLCARRGAIPLIGPDLPDELHITLADGVKASMASMATVSCARLQVHKARDRCALGAARCAELGDLNLHAKSRLAIDLASRVGDLVSALVAVGGTRLG